jgi:actin-related protein
MINKGCSEIKGIEKRLQEKITEWIAMSETCNEYQPKEIQFKETKEYMSAYKNMKSTVCFLGACIVGKVVFGSGGYGYISKEDYQKHGPRVAHLL